jgi:cell division protease FtsH
MTDSGRSVSQQKRQKASDRRNSRQADSVAEDHATNTPSRQRPSGGSDRDAETGPPGPRGLEAMGPLEFNAYRRLWRSSARFRHGLTAAAATRKRTVARTEFETDPEPERDAGTLPTEFGLATPRDFRGTAGITESSDGASRRGLAGLSPTSPASVAAALLFARIFDERPELLNLIHSAAPTIAIDIADSEMLRQVEATWKEVLFDGCFRLLDLANDRTFFCRTELDAAYLVVKEPPKPLQRDKLEKETLRTLSLALPVIAISPMARTHLPDVLNRSATATIDFPRLDPRVVTRVIRIVTGRICRELIEDAVVAKITPSDLVVAARFDRTPTECVSELRRLVGAKEANKEARDLTLSDLHGLGEARAWAEAAISDIKAWKESRIPWSEVASGIALSGPPGCGKTTFASVFCREAGLHMVSATLAKWQSSGEAHLGHLLRAMRQDFEEARANAPSCVFIDEIDSLPDRAGVTHAWRDYVVEVVNALLAEIDGIRGREGVVVIGASNEIGRCDPALLRAGRLEKIVKIGLPDLAELERMFRVRLRSDLDQEDLSSIVELAVGMVGADVERIVKDARRTARMDGKRSVTLRDLRNALAPEDDRPLEQRWLICVHEAAHLVIDVIHFDPDGAYATTARIGSRVGMSVRIGTRFMGTPDDYRRQLQVILAGRAGEEVLLGIASHGAGGVQGSDLARATSLAAAMVGSLGLIDSNHLTYLGPSRDAEGLLVFAEVRQAVARELADAYSATRLLLTSNRAAVEAVAQWLLERGRVTGEEAAGALRQFGGEKPHHPIGPNN